MTVLEQTRAFLGMMICGACVGAAHDLLAVLRQNRLVGAAADLLLGLLCAACVICAGLRLACDPFRLHTFIGVGLGWTIYVLSLGTIVRFLMKSFINLSKKVTN